MTDCPGCGERAPYEPDTENKTYRPWCWNCRQWVDHDSNAVPDGAN